MCQQPFHTTNSNRALKRFYLPNIERLSTFKLFTSSRPIYSYNVFLITKDGKMVLCKRRHSFYLTYIRQRVHKRILIMPYEINIIAKCLENLPVNEYTSLEAFLTEKEIDDPDNHFAFFRAGNFKILRQYSILLDVFKKKRMFCLRKSLILPGGKRDKKTENQLTTVKREIYEETNLDISNKPCYLLNNTLDLQKIDWENTESVTPLLIYWSIYDKVLQKNFHNMSYIMCTDFTADEALQNFASNIEISEMLFKCVNIKQYDKIGLRELRDLFEQVSEICS